MKRLFLLGLLFSVLWGCGEGEKETPYSKMSDSKKGTFVNSKGVYLKAAGGVDSTLRIGVNSVEVEGEIATLETSTEVLLVGHCWSSTNKIPQYNEKNTTKVRNLKNIGKFRSVISGLNMQTTYYVRAYIVTQTNNKIDTGYSPNIKEITTQRGENMWIQKANVSEIGREGAISFVIDGKAYFGTGNNGAECFYDFWEYQSESGTWVQKANIPYKTAQTNSVGFAIGKYGYVAGGVKYSNGKVEKTRTMWRYNSQTNIWDKAADFPSEFCKSSSVFVIDGKAYVGGGKSTFEGTQFFCYSPSTDIWRQIAPIPQRVSEAAAFSVNGKGYVCTGVSENKVQNFVFEYEPMSDKWTRKADFQGQARNNAMSFVLNNEGYIAGGCNSNIFFDDCWKYDAINDQWIEMKSNVALQRANGIAFSLENSYNSTHVFVGTGILPNRTSTNDLWEYLP